ncbi:histidine phosphatase family protein [Cereibacter changlensis]|uniref:Histidine phosphatase family protein n=1 Tax=Cereibacter changlensis TaxID=402884 RepID=A0A4V5NNX7_9RHOB|nr:histidine phosphatase family protein [Cereibacter changlensis]TKA94587.1 histidine phosphatase family protein [Cereibacter changlensis]
MKRLLLVRHGESVWNATRRLQGQADIPLSERGQDQVRALAPLVARLAPDLVLTSDLQRARQSAALLGHPDARLQPLLREISVGDWTGESIDALDPGPYQDWREGSHVPEGGESWAAFSARTGRAVDEAQAEGQATVLMVCHGGVIRALLDRLVGLAPRHILPVGPASLTVLGFRNGLARLEALNVTPGGLSLDAPD